ncbi:PDDEXK-like family protein [Clostridium sp. Marseille-P299]|uniref:PDDEXK-like family protein n=1 Tax=Clostridium sp. Marseille-P299 TaxID=1805477 RepID=UPI00082E6897|nr:PD-(D/E)XK nuclease family protein [Clostridium sp. Marseille-P299]
MSVSKEELQEVEIGAATASNVSNNYKPIQCNDYNELNKTDEEALQNFLLDIECLDELSPWTSKLNIFDVLKVSKTEIRHSNMLSWLLNPNENHGLGDLFIKGVVQRIVENDVEGKYNIFQLLLMDFYSFIIYREWKNIDLLLVSEDDRILIAIENKIGSREHSNQLNRYRNILEKEYPEYQRIYIYLTPDGEEPSDVENWSILTYTDIVEVLEATKRKINLLPDVELIIKNYLDTLRRDIVQDERLIEICNKIYQKHKKALDLIYEYRVDGRSQVSECIMKVLKEQAERNELIFDSSICSNSFLRFNTYFMDQYLTPICEKNSSWNTQQIYFYWFDIKEDRFRVVFEVGGLNVPNNQMENMQKIISILKPNDKNKNNFKYKRLFSTKWFKFDDLDNNEEDITEKTILALKDIKKFEEKLSTELINIKRRRSIS